MRGHTATVSGTFVGRQAEIGALTAAVHEAQEGRGGLVLVTGEAGIGKSRLVTEVAAYAGRLGLATVWGVARPSASSPLGPWREVLRSVGAPPVEALAPEGASREAALDAVAHAVATAARSRPHVITFEDLHWTDEATILQLEWLRPMLVRLPLLVLATSRVLPNDLGRPDTHLALTGLSSTEVAVLAGAMAPELRVEASELYARSGGNPFFVLQMATWGRAGVPPTISALLSDKIGELPAPARVAVHAAAVIGTEFDAATLDAVVPGAASAIGAVVARGLIEPAGGGSGRLRFVHELSRDVALGGLAEDRRQELHERVADVLEAQPEADPATVASHLEAAGAPPRFVVWATRAGDRAASVHAHEDAASWYERARAATSHDAEESLDLLLAAADAWARSGQSHRAWRAFELAAVEARARGDAVRLAIAALGFGGGRAGFEVSPFHQPQRALLEKAVGSLAPAEHTLRALVLARLSVAMSFSSDVERRHALVEEAVAEARASADSGAVVAALSAWCDANAGPDHVEERLRAADEMIDAAQGDRQLELLGLRFKIVAVLEQGDLADAEIARFERVAGELHEPRVSFYVPLFRAMRALAGGRIDEADSLNEDALAIGRTANSENAEMLAVSQRIAIRLHQGRAGELEPLVRHFADAFPDIAGPQAGVAIVEAHTDRLDAARARLDRFVAQDFAGFPVDAEWLPAMAAVANTAARTRHRPTAERLLRRLLPYRHLFALDGIGAALFGPVARSAGQLADVLGRFDLADELFAESFDRARRSGAALLVAQSAYSWASSLRRRVDPRAGELDALAHALLRQMGTPMSALMVGAPEGPAPEDPRPIHEGGIEPGEVWVVRWGGGEARLRDSKGLRYIAELLRRPGVYVHALELAAPDSAGVRLDSDLGPVLDEEARDQFRRRADRLRSEIEEARAAQHASRAQHLEDELDALIAALAAAAGLGGRARRPGSAAERARVNVTKAIRQAIDRIEPQLPDLAHHLRTTVRTGTFCRYEPDPTRPPQWQIQG